VVCSGKVDFGEDSSIILDISFVVDITVGDIFLRLCD